MRTVVATFGPEGKETGGAYSFMTWQNPDVMKGLKLAFNIKDYEYISAILIEENGISVRVGLK